MLKVDDCGKRQGQLLVTAWPLSVPEAPADGHTPMYIWKALTGLRGSFFKSPGSYERVEKSRVGVGGVGGKTVTMEKKKHIVYMYEI